MLRVSIKNNIKTVIREPSTILALLAALIMEFMYGVNIQYGDMYGNIWGKELYLTEDAFERILNTMMNLVGNPISNIVFVFMGGVIALNLFKDIRLQTYDIMISSGLSFFKYYLSKIISYYLLALGLSFGLTMIHEILFVIFCLPSNPNFNVGTVMIANFVAMLFLYTSALLHTFTYAIFFASLTGIAFVGLLFNAIYYYIPSMISALGFGSAYYWYIHVTPMVMFYYLKYWSMYPVEQRFQAHLIGGNSVTNYLWADIYQVSISFVSLIAIALILLTVSYFLLKRRFRKA